MKTKIMRVVTVMLVLGFAGMATATTVQLDLFDLGCPTEFNWDNPYWQTNFDLGVTFTKISNVYIDWAGDITAGLAIDYGKENEPFPLDVGSGAALKKPPLWRYIILKGGETTYPDPELFDCLSEFLYGDMPWSELFDGQSIITIQYMEPIILDGRFIEHGSITLDNATLVVEGTIIPEPATIILLGAGFIVLILRRKGTYIK